VLVHNTDRAIASGEFRPCLAKRARQPDGLYLRCYLVSQIVHAVICDDAGKIHPRRAGRERLQVHDAFRVGGQRPVQDATRQVRERGANIGGDADFQRPMRQVLFQRKGLREGGRQATIAASIWSFEKDCWAVAGQMLN
jgi:hypothetical protein